MSKAFTKEGDGPEDEPEHDAPDPLPPHVKNYMTPQGFTALRAELKQLMRVERPKVVEIVSWAASLGDRSENGDYLYNKRRLREIDRRVRYLTKRIESAEVVDPRQQQHLEQIFFGATVTYLHEEEHERTVTLVGIDEADVENGKINWISPVGQALLKKKVGDKLTLRTAEGAQRIEVLEITYTIVKVEG